MEAATNSDSNICMINSTDDIQGYITGYTITRADQTSKSFFISSLYKSKSI